MVPSSSQIVDCLAAHAAWSMPPPVAAGSSGECTACAEGAARVCLRAVVGVVQNEAGSYLHLLEMLMRMMAEVPLFKACDPDNARSTTSARAEDVSDWRVVVKISDGVDQ